MPVVLIYIPFSQELDIGEFLCMGHVQQCLGVALVFQYRRVMLVGADMSHILLDTDVCASYQEGGIFLGRSDPKSPDLALFVRTNLGLTCAHTDRVALFCPGSVLVFDETFACEALVRTEDQRFFYKLFVRIMDQSYVRERSVSLEGETSEPYMDCPHRGSKILQ